MYFWRVKNLIDDLKNHKVTERQFKNYYLGISILITFGMYVSQLTPRLNTLSLIVEFVIGIGLMISAVGLLFRANGGDTGQHFLNRIISLMLPIAIKTMVLSIVPYAIFAGIIQYQMGILQNPDVIDPRAEWLDTGFSIVLQVIMYWYLYDSLKKVNR